MRHLPARRPDTPNLIFWLPTFAGVLVLLAGLIFALMRLDSPDPAAGKLPQPIAPFQPLTPASFLPQPGASGSDAAPTAEPGGGAAEGTGGTTTRPAPPGNTATARPPASPSPTVRPPTTAPTVSGTYRVLNSYGDAFIGEVLVGNSAAQEQNWTVTLRFPSSVGQLYTSWVEGAPQATLTTSGATYTWRSGVPVPGKSSVPLRFHFARSGTGNFPTACTVNGAACKIS
jgi:hypothetical protein